jgi:DNA-binding NtrC family response regulator
LENLVERLVVLNDDGVIRAADLPDYVRDYCDSTRQEDSFLPPLALPVEGLDLDGLLQELENDFILQALSRTRGNKTLAAELLRLNRTTLIERMRKRKLEAPPRQVVSPLLWSSVRTMTMSDFSLTTPSQIAPPQAA